MTTDRLMSLREVCQDVLHCSYAKGQKLMKAGALPGKKLGNTYAIPRRALFEVLGLAIDVEEGHDE